MTEQGGSTCRTAVAPATGIRPWSGGPSPRPRSAQPSHPATGIRPWSGGTVTAAPVRTAGTGAVQSPAPAAAPRARGLTGRPALLLLASLIVALLAASAAPTPL